MEVQDVNEPSTLRLVTQDSNMCTTPTKQVGISKEVVFCRGIGGLAIPSSYVPKQEPL